LHPERVLSILIEGEKMTIVTISRFTMTGGRELAECVAERLGIPSLSREVIAHVADQFGISEEVLWEKLSQTRQGVQERYLYLCALQLFLAERAQKGPFVYHGLAGHFLMRGIPQILKVGIVAPLKQRAETFMKRKNVGFEEAVRSVERWDEMRRKWVRFLYRVDWLDPSLYDMVINIGSIGVQSACDLVIFTMDREEFKELPERQRMIDDFALAAKVQLQLALHDRTKGLELKVRAERQAVTIRGRVLTSGIFRSGGRETTRNDIIEVASHVSGVRSVSVDLEETTVPLE
jgi:cytidylate kinase